MENDLKKQREQSRAKVIEALNKARDMELQAITLYMNQHYNLDYMDYGELARNVKLIAIDEMRHAERFAERVRELGGEPIPSPTLKLRLAQDIRELFPFDASNEDGTIFTYNKLLSTCRENGDNKSAKLFETIIDEEQIHFNYFDNVGGHIERLGDAFLSRIAGTSASTGPASKGFVMSQGQTQGPGQDQAAGG